MRCPQCQERNSVAAKKCEFCGNRFKKKPLPLGVKLGVGGVMAALTVSVAVSAILPHLMDPEQNLSRAAKRMVAGPKTPQEATTLKREFNDSIKEYLRTTDNRRSADLSRSLQKVLGSSAFEVHVVDLPKNLKLVEVDALLQASTFIVMKAGSGTKVFPIERFEVFDDARILNDSAGPVLALLGHSGGQPPHVPQVKTFALLPDYVSDETEKLVPALDADGSARFDRNGQDIRVEVSVASLAKPENISFGSDKEESAQLLLVWKDARYIPKWDFSCNPVGPAYALAKVMRNPKLSGAYQQLLGATGSRVALDHTESKAPIYISRSRSTTPGVIAYKIGARSSEVEVKVQKNGSTWAVIEAVAVAPGKQTSTESSAAPPQTALQPTPARLVSPSPSLSPVVTTHKPSKPDSHQAVISGKQPSVAHKPQVQQVSTKRNAAPVQYVLSQPAPAAGTRKKDRSHNLIASSSRSPIALPAATKTNAAQSSRNSHSSRNQSKPVSEPVPHVANLETFSGKAQISQDIGAGSVRLRSSPSTNGKPVDEIAKGATFEIVGKTNGWYKVRHQGREGFVYGGLVDLKKPSAYTTAVVTKSKVVTDGRHTLGAPQVGDRVVVVGGIKNNKYKVQLSNGKTGYIDKDGIDVAVETPILVP